MRRAALLAAAVVVVAGCSDGGGREATNGAILFSSYSEEGCGGLWAADPASGALRWLARMREDSSPYYASASREGRIALGVILETESGGELPEVRLLMSAGGRTRVVAERTGFRKASWSPVREELLALDFERRNSHLVLVDVAGNKAVRASGPFDEHVSWAPDGESFAYVGAEAGVTSVKERRELDVRSVDRDGGRSRVLVEGHAAPEWSPDGETIAFKRKPGDDAELWVAGSDGSGARRLATHRYDEALVPVGWSADSRWIYVVDGIENPETGHGHVSRVEADSGRLEVVVRNAFPFAVSPDRRRILYGLGRGEGQDGYYVLKTSALDGSDARTIGAIDEDGVASWAPSSELDPIPGYEPNAEREAACAAEILARAASLE